MAEDSAKSFLSKLIWIDLEMSGLSPERDEILEVAMIITDPQLNIIAESESWAVHQPDSVLDSMDSWNTRTHTQSGLIDRCRRSPLDTKKVERLALRFVKKHINKHRSPMCGNSICQDRRFLARLMPEFEDYFHYRNFDVSTFKIAAQLYFPDLAQKIKESKAAEHQALGDIRASIDEMREYMNSMLRMDDAQ